MIFQFRFAHTKSKFSLDSEQSKICHFNFINACSRILTFYINSQYLNDAKEDINISFFFFFLGGGGGGGGRIRLMTLNDTAKFCDYGPHNRKIIRRPH